MSGFFGAFWPTFQGIVKIFLVGLLGYIAYKKGAIKDGFLSGTSYLLTYICLPAYIFANIISHTEGLSLKELFFINAFYFGIFGITWLLAALSARLFGLTKAEQAGLIPLAVFQNAGYLPLILIGMLMPTETAVVLNRYVFYFLIGFNLMIWSYGVVAIDVEGHKQKNILAAGLRKALNAPFIATFAALAIALLGWGNLIPKGILDTIHWVGSPTLILSVILIGGMLAQASTLCVRASRHNYIVGILFVLKLLIFPLAGLLLSNLMGLSPLMKWFVVLELAVPSAVTLSVLAGQYNGDTCLISKGLLYTNIGAAVTLPLWLALARI